MSVSEVETKLRSKFMKQGTCEEFGEISSILARQDAAGRLYAFVCFKNKENAKEALKNLENRDLFKTGEPLYVNQAMKKQDRQAFLQKQHNQYINETNIFTKNLKQDLAASELQTVFAQFGEIISCVVKESSNPVIKTKFGFVQFKTKQEAFKVLVEGYKNDRVKLLYDESNIYLNLHMPSQRYD